MCYYNNMKETRVKEKTNIKNCKLTLDFLENILYNNSIR